MNALYLRECPFNRRKTRGPLSECAFLHSVCNSLPFARVRSLNFRKNAFKSRTYCIYSFGGCETLSSCFNVGITANVLLRTLLSSGVNSGHGLTLTLQHRSKVKNQGGNRRVRRTAMVLWMFVGSEAYHWWWIPLITTESGYWDHKPLTAITDTIVRLLNDLPVQTCASHHISSYSCDSHHPGC